MYNNAQSKRVNATERFLKIKTGFHIALKISLILFIILAPTAVTFAQEADTSNTGVIYELFDFLAGAINIALSFVGTWAIVTSSNLFNWVFDNTVIGFASTYQNGVGFGVSSAIRNGVDQAWLLSRNLANLLIIAMFTFSAVATILRITSYELKAWIVKILIVAVLINFSMFFVKVAIDLSNALAYQIYNSVEFENGAGLSDAILNLLNPVEMFNDVPDGFNPMAKVLYAFFVAFAMGIASATLVYGSVVMMGRFLGLIVIMAISAAGFAAQIFPMQIGHDFFTKWWKALARYTLFAPLFTFMIVISINILSNLQTVTIAPSLKSSFQEASKMAPNQPSSNTQSFSGGLNLASAYQSQLAQAQTAQTDTSAPKTTRDISAVIMYMFITIGLFHISIKVASQLSIAGTNAGLHLASWANRASTAPARLAMRLLPFSGSLKTVAGGKGYPAYIAAKAYNTLYSPKSTLVPSPAGLSYQQKEYLNETQKQMASDTFIDNIKDKIQVNNVTDTHAQPAPIPQDDANTDNTEKDTTPTHSETTIQETNINTNNETTIEQEKSGKAVEEIQGEERKIETSTETARQDAHSTIEQTSSVAQKLDTQYSDKEFVLTDKSGNITQTFKVDDNPQTDQAQAGAETVLNIDELGRDNPNLARYLKDPTDENKTAITDTELSRVSKLQKYIETQEVLSDTDKQHLENLKHLTQDVSATATQGDEVDKTGSSVADDTSSSNNAQTTHSPDVTQNTARDAKESKPGIIKRILQKSSKAGKTTAKFAGTAVTKTIKNAPKAYHDPVGLAAQTTKRASESAAKRFTEKAQTQARQGKKANAYVNAGLAVASEKLAGSMPESPKTQADQNGRTAVQRDLASHYLSELEQQAKELEELANSPTSEKVKENAEKVKNAVKKLKDV